MSLLLGVLVFAIDRGHKFLQLELLGWRGGEFVQVTSFFNYVLVWNPGISYGFLGDLPQGAILLIMVLAILLLLVWLLRTRSALVQAGLAVCLGGAVSHVIDRLVYGAVPDFFHFHWGDWSFYVFNIADTAITLGLLLLFLDAFRPEQRRAR